MLLSAALASSSWTSSNLQRWHQTTLSYYLLALPYLPDLSLLQCAACKYLPGFESPTELPYPWRRRQTVHEYHAALALQCLSLLLLRFVVWTAPLPEQSLGHRFRLVVPYRGRQLWLLLCVCASLSGGLVDNGCVELGLGARLPQCRGFQLVVVHR